MNNQEPELNPTPAETDSAKTNESVQREGSELPVKARLASDLLPAIRAALADRRFISPSLRLDEAKPISPDHLGRVRRLASGGRQIESGRNLAAPRVDTLLQVLE